MFPYNHLFDLLRQRQRFGGGSYGQFRPIPFEGGPGFGGKGVPRFGGFPNYLAGFGGGFGGRRGPVIGQYF